MTRERLRGLALLAASSALLTACASIPDLGSAPEIRPATSLASAASLPVSPVAWPSSQWWKIYSDPQLDALINEALAGAPDLAVAEARFRIAAAYAEQSGAALLPAADATANAGYSRQSENNGIPAAIVPDGWQQFGKVGIGLSLDLDLWGKNRAARDAAVLDAAGARFEVEYARLALTTGIASAYADLALLYAKRDTLESALAIRQSSLDLVERRLRSGLDTKAEYKQAASRVPAARADLAATDEAIELQKHAIAALLGAGPDRGLGIMRPRVLALREAGVPNDATLNLVGRRPDIAAARASVEAEAKRIKVAKAAFYPNVNLSALVGLQAIGLDKLVDGGSTFGSVGSAISLPMFHGGALSGQYRAARGKYDEAVAVYDGRLVNAVREVADVLTSQRALSIRLNESRAALMDAEAANQLARMRYNAGLSNYLDVLSAEENLLDLRLAVAELETRAFVLDVAMVRALGGGFSA